MKLIPIILAGGSGTRLWPLSRETFPKQFISLESKLSLFQLTLNRLACFEEVLDPIVVVNEQHRFLVAEQIRQTPLLKTRIILEPCFKSTAPAIALAAHHAIKEHGEDVLLLVLAADHVIQEISLFKEAVDNAIYIANQNYLVTFGVKPTRPETGYGYIEQGTYLLSGKGFNINRFVEKPNLEAAEHYLSCENYWWNSGMFLFKANTLLHELKILNPTILHSTQLAYENAKFDVDFIRPSQEIFLDCPTDSIDYAIMEKTNKGAMVALQSDWNDVGNWQRFSDLFTKDNQDNTVQGDVYLHQTHNSFIYGTHKRLIVTMSINDLIIVDTEDALLVMHKTEHENLKNMVNLLRQEKRKEISQHHKVNRPWGSFESIINGERFQVKRITVNIDGKLSLQKHHHRSEHWIVVTGTARVTRNDEIFLLSENQSTYIPIGATHRLENVGKIPLEMIEVQSGSYLGEDDIIRLEDEYGRLEKQSLTTA